jgi:hypothetical protein
MPFDGTDYPDLSVPSLRNLAFILRHKETWPPGFYWNYCRADSCALGLAVRVWKEASYRIVPIEVYLGAH